MNSVNIIGRLTMDPELRYSQQGKAVTSLSIAVPRNKEETDFFNCTAFDKVAETIANSFVKGKEIGISGRLQQERWEDQQGQKRSTVKIIINSITFIGPKTDGQQSSQQPPQAPPQGYPQQQPPYGQPPGYPGQQAPYGQPPGFIPPNQGFPPQQPGGYPQQQNGYPQQQGQPNQWQPPTAPPNSQPPQGQQIGFQHPGQQPPTGSYNIDDIPF